MRIKAVLILTFAIVLTLFALILHLSAIFSKRWIVSIPRRFRGPNDQARYYGLWSRCQYSNTSFVIPDISSQPNIENFVCRPNVYIRYDTRNQQCYEIRHQCSSIIGIHSDCQCKYLLTTQFQQWCTIIASIFLLLTIIILYLKLIASPQTTSAKLLLTFAPVIFLTLALISMILVMIIVGAYLRRNQYEEFDIRLPRESFSLLPNLPDTVNLYRLKAFFQTYKNPDLYKKTLAQFRSIHNERFHTRIDWSAAVEIIAIILTLIADIFSMILALAQVN